LRENPDKEASYLERTSKGFSWQSPNVEIASYLAMRDTDGKSQPAAPSLQCRNKSHVIAGKPCHPELVEGSLSKGACRRELVEGSLSKGACRTKVTSLRENRVTLSLSKGACRTKVTSLRENPDKEASYLERTSKGFSWQSPNVEIPSYLAMTDTDGKSQSAVPSLQCRNKSHVIARKPCHPELVEGSLSKGACRRELVEGSLSKGACRRELVEGSLSKGACRTKVT
jgi:hypothetical protein